MASIFQKMKDRVSETTRKFSDKLDHLFYYKELDDDFFDELEENLILSDITVDTTEEIIDKLQSNIKTKKLKKVEEVIDELQDIMVQMVDVPVEPLKFPVICLVVGVNGVGKTTTIAKLAKKYKNEGKKVLIAAADTFRAAALEQLQTWADRIDVDIISSRPGADPASVVYDAIHSAQAKGADILICDTAGRLHNKVNLMNELNKLSRVVEREKGTYHVHNVLVVDATTGQNALNQAKTFNDAVKLQGIIMTKLDGTAKGGVIIPMINELKIPIEYVGLGEKVEDLVPFDAKDFVKMLYDPQKE
ncbi:signal recognition particle-docking protein FtsY [Pseudoramibacter sp.]|jgi:fused signal recognition particle receptor|uniref:signal recognition particle-docking protein FtsY n=1 Tax=Pseudoramibacter sp. TaxID=2034862 RepID=UPI0025CC5FCB|nr:signal recognition particle-docking protein FtsY [Pseudoramibacter sp.]MCH4072791.1 signal recognition particle-docking protein FtsY [Pseudoramibacter sp.]MCH4106562.1 signal recognition particle-docking protein FtsY [Pseudoramibacter sp.]